VNLASVTRSPTVQHIAERIQLITAQHQLENNSHRSMSLARLMSMACEVTFILTYHRYNSLNALQVKLKQLITHALTLTSTSLAISSVSSKDVHSSQQKVLTAAAFETLFTVAPADLPNKSAAAMRLALGDNSEEDEDTFIPPALDDKPMDRLVYSLLTQRSGIDNIQL
jgi:hypothetical protein